MAAQTPATSRLWSRSEDEILRNEAQKQVSSRGSITDWCTIAKKIPDRSNKDCRKRWSKIGAEIRKGRWTEAEDEQLKNAVKTIGPHWTIVAESVEGRNADQCAKRWAQFLDPRLDHSKWLPTEDHRLLKAVDEQGRNWKLISEKYFPARSSVNVKNRYNTLSQRSSKESSTFSDSGDCSPPGPPNQTTNELFSDTEIQLPSTSNSMLPGPALMPDRNWNMTDLISSYHDPSTSSVFNGPTHPDSLSQPTSWPFGNELSGFSQGIFSDSSLFHLHTASSDAQDTTQTTPDRARQFLDSVSADISMPAIPEDHNNLLAISESFLPIRNSHNFNMAISSSPSITDTTSSTGRSSISHAHQHKLLLSNLSQQAVNSLITMLTSSGDILGMKVSVSADDPTTDTGDVSEETVSRFSSISSASGSSNIAHVPHIEGTNVESGSVGLKTYKVLIHDIPLETARRLVSTLIGMAERALDFQILSST